MPGKLFRGFRAVEGASAEYGGLTTCPLSAVLEEVMKHISMILLLLLTGCVGVPRM